ERIRDDPPYLRDRMQVADRELFARKRDVDDLLAEPAVELGFLDHPLTFRDRGFEALADPVQEDAALAVADPAERLCELALASEVADASLVEPCGCRPSLNRGVGLALIGFPVHGGDCNFVFGQGSSSFGVAGRGRPGMEREVRRRAPGSRFHTGAR